MRIEYWWVYIYMDETTVEIRWWSQKIRARLQIRPRRFPGTSNDIVEVAIVVATVLAVREV